MKLIHPCLLLIGLALSACGDTTTVVESNVECGAGTELVEGECVPTGEPRYEVRVAATEISSDGYSKLSVFAIGTLEDGTPSEENVLFGLSRAGFGGFTGSELRLSSTSL